MFTSIVLELDMSLAGNISHVERTIEDAKQYCLVLNTLRIPVVIETCIHTPDELGEACDLRQLPPRDTELQRAS
jgi:hypothetical protein